MRDSLLPHGDGVSILPLFAFIPGVFVCMGDKSSRWCPFVFATETDTLFFLSSSVITFQRVYTQRNMADSILLLFARLKTQCRKSCPCDTATIYRV
jgi:hypothetical protein